MSPSLTTMLAQDAVARRDDAFAAAASTGVDRMAPRRRRPRSALEVGPAHHRRAPARAVSALRRATGGALATAGRILVHAGARVAGGRGPSSARA